MRARRVMRSVAVTGVGALIVALGAGPALAGDEPPEDGLIAADDLSGDWEEGPPEEDEDELDETAEEIDACQDIAEITTKLEDASKVEGSTFTLDGQEITSGVGVVAKRLAKRAVKVYGSGDGAECFEELLAASPITADFEVLTDSGDGPEIGDGSAFITAVLTGEDPTTGEVAELTFQLVIIRVGKTLAIYEYQSEGEGANAEEFTDAVEAAGERLEEAA